MASRPYQVHGPLTLARPQRFRERYVNYKLVFINQLTYEFTVAAGAVTVAASWGGTGRRCGPAPLAARVAGVASPGPRPVGPGSRPAGQAGDRGTAESMVCRNYQKLSHSPSFC